MFDVIPTGYLVDPNTNWIKEAEQNGFCHWVIHEQPDGSEFRALYNGLCYWAKVFRWHADGTLIYLFDLTTLPEEDEETGESYLPNVTEGAIREFLGWRVEDPVAYR